jgi:hypothetical protein
MFARGDHVAAARAAVLVGSLLILSKSACVAFSKALSVMG